MNAKFYVAPDRFVRVPASALSVIRVQHVVSAIDLSIAIPKGLTGLPSKGAVTGYTEWAGWFQQAQVTVGWDWCVVREAVVVLDPTVIRTNIQITDDDQTVVSPVVGRIHILEWIETLPWQKYVLSVDPAD